LDCRVAASDNPFGIFKLFLLLDCRVAASDNPFVIFNLFLLLDCRVAASDNLFVEEFEDTKGVIRSRNSTIQ
jgi:hypothetical protein